MVTCATTKRGELKTLGITGVGIYFKSSDPVWTVEITGERTYIRLFHGDLTVWDEGDNEVVTLAAPAPGDPGPVVAQQVVIEADGNPVTVPSTDVIEVLQIPLEELSDAERAAYATAVEG